MSRASLSEVFEQRSDMGRKGALATNGVLTFEQRLERGRRLRSYLTHQLCRENERKGGLAAAKSVTPEKRLEIMRKTIARLTPEQLSENGRKGVHKQWHLSRCRPNLECEFCTEEGLSKAA